MLVVILTESCESKTRDTILFDVNYCLLARWNDGFVTLKDNLLLRSSSSSSTSRSSRLSELKQKSNQLLSSPIVKKTRFWHFSSIFDFDVLRSGLKRSWQLQPNKKGFWPKRWFTSICNNCINLEMVTHEQKIFIEACLDHLRLAPKTTANCNLLVKKTFCLLCSKLSLMH